MGDNTAREARFVSWFNAQIDSQGEELSLRLLVGNPGDGTLWLSDGSILLRLTDEDLISAIDLRELPGPRYYLELPDYGDKPHTEPWDGSGFARQVEGCRGPKSGRLLHPTSVIVYQVGDLPYASRVLVLEDGRQRHVQALYCDLIALEDLDTIIIRSEARTERIVCFLPGESRPFAFVMPLSPVIRGERGIETATAINAGGAQVLFMPSPKVDMLFEFSPAGVPV